MDYLFGGTDFSIQGDYATPSLAVDSSPVDYNPQLPEFQQRMFGDISTDPSGQNDIASRSNSAFWDFDQSKISAGIMDVINSGIQAGGKLAIQSASDSINAGAKQNNPFGQFLQNFQSTKTGAQINAGAYATRIQNWFANPLVWFGGLAILVLWFLLRK